MKKIYTLFALFIPFFCPAQSGIISTVYSLVGGVCTSPGSGAGAGTLSLMYDLAGNAYANEWQYIYKFPAVGTWSIIAGGIAPLGYSGDGGPAVDAGLNMIGGKMALDRFNNFYIADAANHRIRKINAAGIITTIAGTGVKGHLGDGGPALSALIDSPMAIAVDRLGNIYFSEGNSARIRKINDSGFITTIAGTGSPVLSGDGGSALLAGIGFIRDIAVDGNGNLFLLGPTSIRKISSSGIISTVTYCDEFISWGIPYTGDGGPAISALSTAVRDIDVDLAGNIYMACRANGVIRKINTAGIISTIAGVPPVSPWECLIDGDGGPATSAHVCAPAWVWVHPSGDVYFGQDGSTLRKISYPATASADSFYCFVTKTCGGAEFFFEKGMFSPGSKVKSYYGDGTVDTTVLTAAYGGMGNGTQTHIYAFPGDYTIKHVLFNGSSAIDSFSYPFHFDLCNNVNLKFFYDINANGVFDSTSEPLSHTPTIIQVDSNGVPIDSISVTSGYYYTCYGNPGDVYSFTVVHTDDSFHVTTPVSTVVTDTLTSAVYNSATKYVGFSCAYTPSYNLFVRDDLQRMGVNIAWCELVAGNHACNSQDGTITMTFSPKYTFVRSYPAGSSVAGNTVIWNIAGMSADSPLVHIAAYFRSTIYFGPIPGDTVHTTIVISPVAGDMDASNNTVFRIDTIRAGYDPNDISVSPAGKILNGTELEYTIHFENTGNDTAHNIFVLDTLAEYLDPATFEIVGASHTMFVCKQRYGSRTIVKFDFPNIMLPDSSHHDQCQGMFVTG